MDSTDSRGPTAGIPDGGAGERIFARLEALATRPCPIGHEYEYNTWLGERWKAAYGLEYQILPPGNLVACTPDERPSFLLVAHSDEIGFVVKGIEENGLLAIAYGPTNTNGPDRNMHLHIAGQPGLVLADNGYIEGVFTTHTGHVVPRSQTHDRVPDFSEFRVDIGVSSRDEAVDLGIGPGTPIVWNTAPRRIGTSRCHGKAMDNRASLAVLEEVMELTEGGSAGPFKPVFVSTALEEIGALGAEALAHSLGAPPSDDSSLIASIGRPAFAIVVDIGLAGDYPSVSKLDVSCKLGDGPTLVVKDNHVHYDRRLMANIELHAKDKSLRLHRSVFGVHGGYTSDGLSLIRSGIPTALLAFPGSYTHSPFEMVDLDDLAETAWLLTSMVGSANLIADLGY